MSYFPSNPSTTSRSSTIQKQYQAFIVLVPISILLLLFYFLYLRRQRALRSIRASIENSNDVPSVELGLGKEMRERLPIVLHRESFSARDAQCSVCLGNYQADDRLQQIPVCGHLFHMDCIGHWLNTHTTCPLCRLSLLVSMKTPVEPVDIQVETSQGSVVSGSSNTSSREESSQVCEETKAIKFSR